MKILHVCYSDNLGGAAVVTRRLMNALRAKGVDARMLVINRFTNDPFVESYSSTLAKKTSFMAERLQILLNNGFSRANLFKVDTASFGADISHHPWVMEADIINLNWINQGALSLNAIHRLARAGKQIIWTMHDMWNCTGICHHAYECRAYTTQCLHCPYLANYSTLAHLVQKRKELLYSQANIHFVAVSHWLADRCRESNLMKHVPLSVIPNAFPVEQFPCEKKTLPNVPTDKKVVVMGAARLDDSIKGFPELIKVTQQLAKHPDHNLHLVLFGSMRDKTLLEQLAIPYTYMGRVDSDYVPHIYAAADIVISTSHYETLPGTLVEGIAAGCLAVTFGHGGQRDIVEHLTTGYIAQYRHAEDMAKGILWAANHPVDRKMLHVRMHQKFNRSRVAEQYINLSEKILRKSGKNLF